MQDGSFGVDEPRSIRSTTSSSRRWRATASTRQRRCSGGTRNLEFSSTHRGASREPRRRHPAAADTASSRAPPADGRHLPLENRHPLGMTAPRALATGGASVVALLWDICSDPRLSPHRAGQPRRIDRHALYLHRPRGRGYPRRLVRLAGPPTPDLPGREYPHPFANRSRTSGHGPRRLTVRTGSVDPQGLAGAHARDRGSAVGRAARAA